VRDVEDVRSAEEIKRLKDILEELKDIKEIKKLKARYCYVLDERRWDELLEVWAEDAVVEFGAWGVFKGKEAIDKFYKASSASLSFVVHIAHNPIIEVRGDSASGQWYLTSQVTVAATNQAAWIMGRYHDQYQREGNQWKIKSMKLDLKYHTPYGEGWAKTPFMTTTA
jgi:ketosteroid isomerase-like protein